MGETLNLIDLLGWGRDFVFGVALAWIIINLHILMARGREYREAADKRSKEYRKAADKRSREEREAADKRSKTLHDAAEKRSKEEREVARQESAKNQAEHAELTAEIHEFKAAVKVLLDRSNRPGPDDSAD